MSPITEAALRAAREQPARNILPLAWSFALGTGYGYLSAWALSEPQAIKALDSVAKLAEFTGARPLFAFLTLAAIAIAFWRDPLADAFLRATLESLRGVCFALGGLAAGAMFGACVEITVVGYGTQDPATIQRTLPLTLAWAGACLAYLVGIDLVTAVMRAVVKL